MALYCAIDLHSTNNVPVVIDENDKILFQKRLPNNLTIVHSALAPYFYISLSKLTGNHAHPLFRNRIFYP